MGVFQSDYYRNSGKKWKWHSFVTLITKRPLRFLLYLRVLQNRKLKIFHPYCFVARYILSKRMGVEILPVTPIGKGLRLVHPYNITVSSEAKLGSNINLYKGCTVGTSSGKHSGTPTIGDNVQIGINATVVGKITVGDDVVIAPNVFLNESVPPHSVVIGNPARIIHKEEATKEHIAFTV